jgi:lysozyme
VNLTRLKNDLIRQEGLRLKLYICPEGKYSIGVGRNLEDNGISENEALMFLDHDVQRTVVECQKNFGDWWFKLNDPRKHVLLNMVFNMGMPRVEEFIRMIAALKKNDFDTAASEMLNSQWASQVKKRAVELSDMMRSGEYPD